MRSMTSVQSREASAMLCTVNYIGNDLGLWSLVHIVEVSVIDKLWPVSHLHLVCDHPQLERTIPCTCTIQLPYQAAALTYIITIFLAPFFRYYIVQYVYFLEEHLYTVHCSIEEVARSTFWTRVAWRKAMGQNIKLLWILHLWEWLGSKGFCPSMCS